MKTNRLFLVLSVIVLLLPSCSNEKKYAESTTNKDTQSDLFLLNENDKKKLIDKLITAFADEWMASYQYWMAAKLVQGAKTPKVVVELMQHYQDELRHSDMIAKRLIELGGDFRMFPKDWDKVAGCHYDSITNTSVNSILKENIKGEECAINFYQDLLNMVKGKDQKTYAVILKILNDEIEHKHDLEKLQKMH
ncbi:MAG: ferritin-like domain-containing protein [bacterium]